DSLLYCRGRPTRRCGRIVHSAGRTPEDHDGIADELVDGPAFLFDTGGVKSKGLIDKLGGLTSSHALASRRQARDVREPDGQPAVLRAGTDPSFLDEARDQHARDVAAESPQAIKHRVE